MLKFKVEIYVPMNTPEQNKVLNKVFKTFCKKFGGATVNPVLGGWVDSSNKLVTDKIGIVYSYVPELTSGVKNFVRDTAINVRETLKEDAVTAVMNDRAEFY